MQRFFFKNHPEIKADKLWGGHLWSHSYYMSTLGNMSKDVIERYIQNQYSEYEYSVRRIHLPVLTGRFLFIFN